jgi:hypothetical protein
VPQPLEADPHLEVPHGEEIGWQHVPLLHTCDPEQLLVQVFPHPSAAPVHLPEQLGVHVHWPVLVLHWYPVWQSPLLVPHTMVPPHPLDALPQARPAHAVVLGVHEHWPVLVLHWYPV